MKAQTQPRGPADLKARVRVLCTIVLWAYALLSWYVTVFRYDWYLAYEAWFSFPFTAPCAVVMLWCACGWPRKTRNVVICITIVLWILMVLK